MGKTLEYFTKIIKTNYIEKEYNHFLDPETYGLDADNIYFTANEAEGYISYPNGNDELGPIFETEYYKNTLKKELQLEYLQSWTHFTNQIKKLTNNDERSLFKNQIIYELKELINDLSMIQKHKDLNLLIKETISKLYKTIRGYPTAANTHVEKILDDSKIVWKADPKLFFLIFSLMIKKKYFALTNEKSTYENIEKKLHEVFHISQLKSEDEFGIKAFHTNIDSKTAANKFPPPNKGQNDTVKTISDILDKYKKQ